MPITKSDLLDQLSKTYPNLLKKDLEKFYDIFINEIKVDGGRMLKRLRPAPQGRAHRIRKRSNHVTVVLESNNEMK